MKGEQCIAGAPRFAARNDKWRNLTGGRVVFHNFPPDPSMFLVAFAFLFSLSSFSLTQQSALSTQHHAER